MSQEPHQRYQQYLQTLTLESLVHLADHVVEDVHFKDPFNDIRGVVGMTAVFHHMYQNVQDIRFTIHQNMMQGSVCLMSWRFEGRLGGKPWGFDGCSVVRFASDGRVAAHIDHWDAARDFYERFPVIGWVLGRIRRRLAVD